MSLAEKPKVSRRESKVESQRSVAQRGKAAKESQNAKRKTQSRRSADLALPERPFHCKESDPSRVAPTPRLAGPLRSQNRLRIGRGDRDVARVRGAHA